MEGHIWPRVSSSMYNIDGEVLDRWHDAMRHEATDSADDTRTRR